MVDSKISALTELLTVASNDILEIVDVSDTTFGASGTNKKITKTNLIGTLTLATITDVTASAAEVNILDGALLSTTELNYVDGVTSAIQTQLNSKQATISLTASRAVVSSAGGVLAVATTTAAEIGFVNGVTSAIQTQLDAKTAKATLTTTGDIYYASSANTPARLGIGSTGQALIVSGGIPAWGTAGTAFWTTVPGTPTRVSDTQFTITDTSNANLYDLLFKKGVVLKWLETATFQTAMVISSSYATNTVTINIVGDSLTAGFTAMVYAISEALQLDFLIPANQSTGTNVSKSWYNAADIYVLSIDAYVDTAGTTNSTDYDVNDDGSTIITTKPSIASGATTDLNNVTTNPSTAVAKDSKVTIDIDAASTTQAQGGTIRLFYYPTEWRYRT